MILRNIGLNVSLKSILGICKKLGSTRAALKRIIFLVTSVFFRRTQLELTICQLGGGSRRLQVLFFNNVVITSFIAALNQGPWVQDNSSLMVKTISFAVSGFPEHKVCLKLV